VRGWIGRAPWFVVAALGCGRSELVPGWVIEPGSVAGTPSIVVGGAAGSIEPGAAGTGGAGATTGGGGQGGAGHGGQASAAGGGQGGAAGGGSAGAPILDRCRVPGPPPDVGNVDGSDFHLGEPSALLDIYPTYAEVSLGDVDGDRRPDLLGADTDELHLYLDASTPTLDELTPLEAGVKTYSYLRGAHLARVDVGDALDVVVGHPQGVSVLWNDGRGSFPRFTLEAGPPTLYPMVVDLDRDGDMDLAGVGVADQTHTPVALYVNDGTRDFSLREVDLGLPLRRLRVADVTGDYLPDLVVLLGREPQINVYAQRAGGEFALAGELSLGVSSPYGVWFDAADLNQDGLSDLVAVQDEDEPDIEHVWIAYQRDGQLAPAERAVRIPKRGGNIAGGEVRTSDLNLDGRTDIVFPSSSFDMVVLIATREGSFRETHETFPTAASIHQDAIAIADVNCDGCPDVVGAQVGGLVLFPGVACAR
jgi:hypothetical protein